MADHASNSAKKFPYLILSNSSAPLENVGSSLYPRSSDNQPKRESSSRGHPKIERQGLGISNAGILSYMEHPYQLSQAVGHELNPALNSISITQMKAILTAQKELRKPAGALYPTSSQISLIPETEMIYKKYFPSDETEKKTPQIATPKSKGAGKEKVGLSFSSSVVSNKTIGAGDCNSLRRRDIQQDHTKTVAAASSISESMINLERKQSNAGSSGGDCSTKHEDLPAKLVQIEKQAAVAKQKDADMRFKKRIQTQLVSLCAEVEKQATDLSDMKKELKELLQISRKNATEIDSSKSRLSTISKHVDELDSKIDSIQESVSGQEKSLLSRLMLFGEISDSDSDFDETNTKGVEVASCPSTTKLSSSKRPFSPGSSLDGLPKSCCNWVPIAPDFDKLIQAIALLNYRMDRNQSMKLCTTNNGATFKHSDVTDLTMYKNGIILGSTGFRSYSTMSVIRFVNEIFNGYLPTELSAQYPDGVVIVLSDKRSVVYACDTNFNGSGTKLALNDPPDLFPGNALNVPHKKESVESLTRASTTVSISSLPVTSRKSSVTSISYEMLPGLETNSGNCETTLEKVQTKKVMLKVNCRKNGCRYKVEVPVNATIKKLADHLSQFISRTAEKDKNSVAHDDPNSSTGQSKVLYDIVLPVPHGKLACMDSTLKDYGLTHNTLIYIQEQ